MAVNHRRKRVVRIAVSARIKAQGPRTHNFDTYPLPTMPPDRGRHIVHYLQGTGHAAPSHPYFKSIAFDSGRLPQARGRRASSIDLGDESEQEGDRLPRTSPAPGLSSAYTQSNHPSSSRPGSSAWLVDLVFAALRPNSTVLTKQLALAALRALTFGDRTWREVNGALLERVEKGITDVESTLQNRQATDTRTPEAAEPESDSPIATAWVGRKLPIQQRPFGNGTSQTSFIIAPEDYEHEAPPNLVDAPPYCLFCIPRKDQLDADDPYHMWVLNGESWDAIKVHAAHPDPLEHPYMLKIRTSDKTPSWVLPESLHREGRRPSRKPLSAATVTIAAPSTASAPETRLSAARRAETTPTSARSKAGVRFSEPKAQEATARSANAVAGPSRRSNA